MGVLSDCLTGRTYHFAQAFPGSMDCTTTAMQKAIGDWFALYFDNEVTEAEDPCQRLAYTVVSKLSRACFAEYEAQAVEQGTFVEPVLRQLFQVRKKAMQLALIGGQAWLKPVPTGRGFSFVVMRRDQVTVLGRDAFGNINALGSVQVSWQGKKRYTLLERRSLNQEGELILEYKLFASGDGQSLGVPVPLSQCGEYAGLQPRCVVGNLGGLGLVELSMPMENCVDGSPDPVSVYAAAAGLIHNINQNERQLSREFEHGESRVFASADLLRREKSGQRKLASGLFVGLDDDPEHTGLTIFAPSLRQESFLARKREYLRNVESVIGLKRGLLGEVEAAQRTATEVTSSQGDYSLTIQDLQQVWQQAVEQAVELCSRLGRMYGFWRGPVLDVQTCVRVSWGNGVLHDKDKEWRQTVELVEQGWLRPEIALAWRYGMPWQSKEHLEQVRRQFMPEDSAQKASGEGQASQ